MSGLSRRALMAAGAAWLAAPAVARAAAPEPLAGILAASGLGELTGFALADLGTGRIVEAHLQDVLLPPASVAKIVTALYAREALGSDYRFRTRVLGSGPVEAGVLRGDLVLEGGGDPVIDTDALALLAEALRAGGLREVTGRFVVAGGALPAVAMIDAGQPDDAAYNPTISGMNLNFNRVFLAWSPGSSGPALRFSAPGEAHEVPVDLVEGELVAAGPPRLRSEPGREVWELPRDGMRGSGSVWLPVRTPPAYAGEVFRGLAGVELPPAEVALAAPGAAMALHESPALEAMVRDMLKYSTNLTAETIGLRAGQVRGVAPQDLASSAAAMSAWARGRLGLVRSEFVNHSGLSDRTRVAAGEMVGLLGRAVELGLPGLLKERPILDARRKPVEIPGVSVVSKTGTMDFVSGLAGYIDGPRRLAFAIFAADPARRARIRPEERANPPGAAAWATRARAQEQALLRRWAGLYAV